jgi:dihydrofolate reductase
MRELIVTENITVDGVIDMAKGWFDPAGPTDVDISDLQKAMREQGAMSDALLLGRQTFEDFRGYWPLQTDDTSGTSDYLNRVSKYVVSSTLGDPEWENTTVLRGDPIDELRALKAMPSDLDITATGSMQLVAALVASGLVDEYRLFVYPFVAGEGQRLFADAKDLGELELVEAQSFRSGVVLLRYRS